MIVTIDRLGRIVVPKKIRDRLHILPGTDLELELDADSIRIRPAVNEPSLIHKQGVLVHHGSELTTLDVAEFVDRDRRNRADQIVAEEPLE